MPKYTTIHMRSALNPAAAIHFVFDCSSKNLTKDKSKVTYPKCRRKMKKEGKKC